MFKIDRAAYLSVLPVVATIATITIIRPLAYYGARFPLEIFSHCSVNVILGFWLWIQWPRTRLTIAVVGVSLLFLFLRTSLSPSSFSVTQLGRENSNVFAFLQFQWFCFLASSAFTLLLRSFIGWRFVDPNHNTDESRITSKATVRDLALAVTFTAIVMVMYRDSWHPHSLPGLNAFHVEAFTISVASIVFLISALRFASLISTFSFALLSPTLILAGGLALGVVRGLSQPSHATDYFLRTPFKSSLGNFTIVATLVSFALICRALNLVLENPRKSQTNKARRRFTKSIAIWSVIMPAIFLAINLFSSQGPLTQSGAQRSGEIGWPMKFASWSLANQGTLRYDQWNRDVLIIDGILNLIIAFAVGFGFFYCVKTLKERIFNTEEHARPRLHRWLFHASLSASMIAFFVVGYEFYFQLNRRSTIFFANKNSDVQLRYDDFQFSFIDHAWTRAINYRSKKDCQAIVGLRFSGPDHSTMLEKSRWLPRLVDVRFRNGGILTDTDVKNVARCDQIKYLTLGETTFAHPELGASLLRMPNLVDIKLPETDIPETKIQDGFTIASRKLKSIDIDLSANSSRFELPKSIEFVNVKLHGVGQPLSFTDLPKLRSVLISFREKSDDVEVMRCPIFDGISIDGIDRDVAVSVTDSPMLESIDLSGKLLAKRHTISSKDVASVDVSAETTRDGFELRAYSVDLKSISLGPNPRKVGLTLGGIDGYETKNVVNILRQLNRHSVVELAIAYIPVDASVINECLDRDELQSLSFWSCQFSNDSFTSDTRNADSNLVFFSIQGSDLRNSQISNLLRRAPELREFQTGITGIKILDLSQGRKLTNVSLGGCERLEQVKFANQIPTTFRCYPKQDIDGGYEFQVFGIKISKSDMQDWVNQNKYHITINGPIRDPDAFRGLDFGNISRITCIDFVPDPEMLKSWRFRLPRSSIRFRFQTDEPITPEIISLVSGKNGFRNMIAGDFEQLSYRPRKQIALTGPHVTLQNIKALKDVKSLGLVILANCSLSQEMVDELNGVKSFSIRLIDAELPPDAKLTGSQYN